MRYQRDHIHRDIAPASGAGLNIFRNTRGQGLRDLTTEMATQDHADQHFVLAQQGNVDRAAFLNEPRHAFNGLRGHFHCITIERIECAATNGAFSFHDDDDMLDLIRFVELREEGVFVAIADHKVVVQFRYELAKAKVFGIGAERIVIRRSHG